MRTTGASGAPTRRMNPAVTCVVQIWSRNTPKFGGNETLVLHRVDTRVEMGSVPFLQRRYHSPHEPGRHLEGGSTFILRNKGFKKKQIRQVFIIDDRFVKQGQEYIFQATRIHLSSNLSVYAGQNGSDSFHKIHSFCDVHQNQLLDISDRGEYLWQILGRTIHSTNLYQLLFYNDLYDPGV